MLHFVEINKFISVDLSGQRRVNPKKLPAKCIDSKSTDSSERLCFAVSGASSIQGPGLFQVLKILVSNSHSEGIKRLRILNLELIMSWTSSSVVCRFGSGIVKGSRNEEMIQYLTNKVGILHSIKTMHRRWRQLTSWTLFRRREK